MPDTLVQVKIGIDLKETLEQLQKQLLKSKRNAAGWICAPNGVPLFHRDPSLGDILRQAVVKWMEEYKL